MSNRDTSQTSLEDELRQDLVDEEVPVDDRIIGRALAISAGVLGLLVLIGGSVWLLLGRKAPEVAVESDAPVAPSLQEVLAVDPPKVAFRDITADAGITFRHVNGAYGERLLPETMGGGVAVFDYDNDDDQDILFVNSRSWPWQEDVARGGSPVLYRNRGDGIFEDVSEIAGLTEVSIYGMGVAVADLDGDGYRDVYLTGVGENRMLRNMGGEHFVDITDAVGAAGDPQDWSTSAAFFDADNDGDLDLFVCNYVQWSREIDAAVDYRLTGIGRAYGPPTNYAGTFSRLYRNDAGLFQDVSAEAGIQVVNPATGLPSGKALAVLPIDVDEDGWMDLIVANDTVQNFFFRNLGDGTFEEMGMVAGLAFDNTGSATGAMGIDIAHLSDFDEIAVAVGNFANEMTSFYVSGRREALFTDQAVVSGVGPGSRQALSFGLFFFDVDLDGRLDLLQTNGHVEDEINVVQPSQHYEQPTQLFWNCGGDCARRFVQMEDDAVGDLARPVVGRGAAYGDFDADGDLDVVITQVNRPPLLLRNEQALGHHWLRVIVKGKGLNTDAIGARVRLTAGDIVQERTVMPTRSYLTQVELPVTFGLGTEDVASLEVDFGGGVQVIQTDVAANQSVVVEAPTPPR